MQLRGIFIFSIAGESRYVPFRLGQLNIVSGASGTGKSALLQIVDYCLGSGTNRVPGEIQDVVSWYGIILTDGHDDILLARPQARGNRTTSLMHVAAGERLDIPRFEDLGANATVDSALDLLAGYIGLSSANIVRSSASSPEYDVTVRHSGRFSFQLQREIAQNEFLFHGQDNRDIAISISDTLPFLLGIIDDEYLAQTRRLRHLWRRLRGVTRELAALLDEETQVPVMAQRLISEAIDVGLLPASAMDVKDYREVLEQADLAAKQPAEFEDLDLHVGIAELRRQRTELLRKYREVRDAASNLHNLATDAADFNQVRDVEETQGSAIELFADTLSKDRCVFCGQKSHVPSVIDLRQQLQGIRRQLSGTKAFQIRTRGLAQAYSEQAEELRSRLGANLAALSGAVKRSEVLAESNRRATLQEHIAGRISLYLEATAQSSDRELLEARIAALELEIDNINAAQADEAVDVRKRLIVSDLSERMARYSRQLDYQYSKSGVEFELRQLTILIDTNTGWKALQQIGSTANYLAIHVAAHLGLHDFFITNDRPSLRFLMLDQPTQAYYPPDQVERAASDLSDVSDEDRSAVVTLFRTLSSFNSLFEGQFQIIVVDHADLRFEPEFQKAMVARWRDGEALVPERWFVRGVDEGP